MITHKDRLLRFGAELIFSICKSQNVEIVIINKDTAATFEENLETDVLEIITVFSARLYGSRSKKNKKLIEKITAVESADAPEELAPPKKFTIDTEAMDKIKKDIAQIRQYIVEAKNREKKAREVYEKIAKHREANEGLIKEANRELTIATEFNRQMQQMITEIFFIMNPPEMKYKNDQKDYTDNH